MRQKVILACKSNSDDNEHSEMPRDMKIVIHFETPGHKKCREKDTGTKKRPAKDQSTPAKRPRHNKTNKGKGHRNWKCAICTLTLSTWHDLNVHVKSAHKETNKKTQESTKWHCGICKRSYAWKGNLYRHVKTAHSKQKTKAECKYCERTYSTIQNLNRHVKTAHSLVTPKKAPVTERTALTKDKENIPNHKGKVHSAKLPKEAVVPEKTGVMKETSPTTGIPKVAVKKFTKYKCTCNKTEDTYDASVRHAQEHLVEWEALIRENGTRCELKFNRHDNGIDYNRSLIETKFDYKTLLQDSWFNMFEPTELTKKILTSSLYKHTRCVKLIWDSEKREGEGHCVPLYKCGACNLIVEPAKVQNHCENHRACVTFRAQGHKCSECQNDFHTPIALRLHKLDHDTYKHLRLRIVTFNNEGDEQFNNALRRMLLPSETNTQAKDQENISKSPATQSNVLEKNVDVQPTSQDDAAMRVTKYCVQCRCSHSDLEDHIAYHKNESKRIMEAIPRDQPCSAEDAEAVANKQINGTVEKAAPHEENVADNDNIERDSGISRGNVQAHQQNEYITDASEDDEASRMVIDSESEVMEWNDSDSDDDNSEDKVMQKPTRNLQGNTENNDVVKERTTGVDDQCESTLRRIFGEDNNGEDMLASDNESQSTDDLQRMLEDDAKSAISDD